MEMVVNQGGPGNGNFDQLPYGGFPKRGPILVLGAVI